MCRLAATTRCAFSANRCPKDYGWSAEKDLATEPQSHRATEPQRKRGKGLSPNLFLCVSVALWLNLLSQSRPSRLNILTHVITVVARQSSENDRMVCGLCGSYDRSSK